MLEKEDEVVAPDSQPLEIPTAESEGQPSEIPSPEVAEAPAAMPESKMRMKAREMGYENDDYEDFMLNHVSGLEDSKKKSEEVNSALWDAIEADPALRETLSQIIQGKPFLVALHEVFTPEELQSAPEDPFYNDVETAKTNRQGKLEADRKRQADMEANSQLSQQAITEFAAENNLSEEEATDFLKTVDAILEDVYSGKITKGFLASMRKALTADQEKEEAVQMAEIAGRNANIEANIINKPMGDGLPSIQGGGEVASPAPERKKSSIERIVDDEKKKVRLV
jgi:hypothetical protein